MVTIRSSNEIILSLIDFFKLAQPDLDTKPGEVARDLFVSSPANALSLLYSELSSVSSQQSLRLVIGSDLDKLAKNFGLTRKQATSSSGVGLFTFSSINSPINIDSGGRVIANNGFGFSVVSGAAVVPEAANYYKSVASKFRDQLDTVGISDTYAIEITLKATTTGTQGNIGKYSLSRTTIPGVSNITNINAFAGGTDQESDVSFRNRILSSFSGASVGTTLGYLNVALSTTGVADAYVVEPGDPLMTRDGTIVKTNSDGSRTILSEGSGGKVDVVILGSTLIDNSNTFIYRDKSNNNDPTNTKNNVVLGQIAGDENKTVKRKRIDNIKNGVLPNQPVNELLEVTGSISGSNYAEKAIDSLGRVSGNFELIKDTGVYAGSPWGFDTFHWISDRISLFGEDRVKGLFNGQDTVTFTDTLAIPKVQQSISISNENSTITSDRSIVQLLHTPVTGVTRVFNVNTGERYIVTDQNLDKTGVYNTTGRIKISGNTLPTASDPLQVDYSWIVNYDPSSDYDGLAGTENVRVVNDSVDWGYASIIKKEDIKFVKDGSGNFFTGTSSHPIASVAEVEIFSEVDATVTTITSGTFANRKAVVVNNLATAPQTIDSIIFKNTNDIELYDTAQKNGTFTVSTAVVGIDVLFIANIILPSDTVAVDGDIVTVFFDKSDVFHSSTAEGSGSGNQITIPSSLINTAANIINLRVNYIANISDLLSASTTSLPVSRVGNGFLLNNNNGFTNFSAVNISRREHQVVQQNNSNQIYVELGLPAADFLFMTQQVVYVVRLSDGKELWNQSNPGTIITGTSGNYQLVLSGLNTPVIGDRVLIVYYATDIRRFQPFSYENVLIKTRTDNLDVDPGTGEYFININKFVTQASSLSFDVVEPNTDVASFSVTDGYLTSLGNGTAFIGSLTENFSTLPDLMNKKVSITGATNSNNDGLYDIVNYDLTLNRIYITNVMKKLTADQICIIRVLDGQEIWKYTGTIDTSNNKLLIPVSSAANINDQVVVLLFKFSTLRKAPTKIIGTTVDQVINSGVMTVTGTSLSKSEDIIFTATNTGLKLNMAEALRKSLGLSSNATLPSNIRLARITKLEKVITASATNDEVLEVVTKYDLKNTTLKNNLLYIGDFLGDSSLQNLDFVLPNTTNNSLNTETHNLPTIGDKMRITFYYTTDNDSENLSYTRNGTLYTNKKFAFLNRIYVSSGFTSSQSTKFSITSFTQPALGTRYKAFYDYLAPKQNERIVIKYNYNKLISDTTFNIENTRPINADVLIRESKQVLLDLTINVVIDDEFKSSQTTVLQNLRDKLISGLTTTVLGSVVDTVTLINDAESINGIARARILYFNKTGMMGKVLKVQAQQDEYFVSNNLIINTETR